MIVRLVHAYRYLLHGEMPPKPNEEAWILYWITLGETRCMVQAAAARDAVINKQRTQARPELTLVGGSAR